MDVNFRLTNMATNKEEKLSEHEEKILCHWNPPRIPVSDVYERRRIYDVFSSFKIKKVSKTVAIQGEYTDLQLLSKEEILGHIQNSYKKLHIGLVQVAVKPLTIEGLNCSALVCLRDGRVPSFENSRLAVIESSLSKGPIYFNSYPSIDVPLTVSGTNTLDTLTLNICTSGLVLNDKGTTGQGRRHHVEVIYKVYYKVLAGNRTKPNDLAKPYNTYKKGATVFEESNLLRHDMVPILQISKWNDLLYPNKWNTTTPVPVQRRTMSMDRS